MIDNSLKSAKLSTKILFAGVTKEEYDFVRPNFDLMNYNVWSAMFKKFLFFLVSMLVIFHFLPAFKGDLPAVTAFIVIVVINNIIMKKVPVTASSYYRFHQFIEMILMQSIIIVFSSLNHPDFPLFFYFILFMLFISSQFNEPYKVITLIVSLGVFFGIMIYFFGTPSSVLPNLVMLALGSAFLAVFNISISISKIVSLVNASKQVDDLHSDQIKSHRHISALASLSKEYEVILYADLLDNSIIDVYTSAVTDFSSSMIGGRITDIIQKYCDDNVYVEDSQEVKQALSISNLKENLDNYKTVSTRYRKIVNGNEVYYELKVIRDENSNGNYPIIIASKNVDIEVRLDMVFRANYDSVRDSATRDSLTGVKNKTAYEWKYQELMQNICDKNAAFAIVMADVNGLKKVNDTLGHSEGDKLITGVCGIISNIYKHSPIYRVGGDEFVVILQNEDYANRDALLSLARDKAVCNDISVSYACGMAIYDAKLDEDVKSVYSRADAAMYENKKAMKAERR